MTIKEPHTDTWQSDQPDKRLEDLPLSEQAAYYMDQFIASSKAIIAALDRIEERIEAVRQRHEAESDSSSELAE